MMERLHALAPVVDEHTRLLILGSLPSARSLAASEYYGNPRNQFWSLIGGVLDLPGFAALPYAERLATLGQRGIGLWDAIAEACREGSLDAALRDVVPADLTSLAARLPRLAVIAFNGLRAEQLAIRHHPALATRFALLRLPQSSPARAMPAGAKEIAWSVLRDHVQPAAVRSIRIGGFPGGTDETDLTARPRAGERPPP